ncbi:MAG: ATP-dependent nuclease [Polyangia bacterium]
MRVETIHIENFRGLADVFLQTTSAANVIVGPNATGKTTILEAIRLAKALLMPTAANESAAVLQSLGAQSPHLPQFLNLPAILKDGRLPLRIAFKIQLDDEELSLIEKNIDQLAARRLRGHLAVLPGQEDLALIQYLSTPQGLQTLTQIKGRVTEEFAQVKAVRAIQPTLEIMNGPNGIRGTRPLDQEIVAFLDLQYLPQSSIFNYFPADRAMPQGEVNIQIGGADAAAQLQTHLAQPATKYTRLKQYIVNQYFSSIREQEQLKMDFELVFNNLLPGKQLEGPLIGPSGNLSVRIKETTSGAVYDIDNMSSGEKGLILTFFLMKRNTADGGIILIDEPELHLNPAVCKKILPFLLDEILVPQRKQAFICTHSPEILGAAFDREDCALHHLRSGTDITQILKSHKAEVFEALERLGAEPSDVLFSTKGTIFLEGGDDIDLLETAMGDSLSGYRLKSLGGRGEVEKEIESLQRSEEAGKLDSYHFFFFDRDRKLSSAKSSNKVRVKQWERYCIENFLLEPNIVYDVMKESLKDPQTVPSLGELTRVLKQYAESEVRRSLYFEQFSRLRPTSPGIRKEEIAAGLDGNGVAHLFWDSIECSRNSMKDLVEGEWTGNFLEAVEREMKRRRETWDDRWYKDASGKEVLRKLHSTFVFRISLLELKMRLMRRVCADKTESWRVLNSALEEGLKRG